ncbi:MAG: class I SAM-dependent methyltransferase [Kiritimatiellae bacterium]|nr:class I SAM-dependent methyltransferase [Kiritimatiellia bacterium]MDW8459543.1 methyltransferase domain-containing protein [Verrucomicrobiota bacterium]
MSLRNDAVSWLRMMGLLRIVASIHQQWLNFVKWICRLRGKSPIDAIYHDRYFAAEEAWTEPSAKDVVDIILARFPVKSIVDVGCGSAVYLRHFQNAGLEVKGYEGSAVAIRRAQIDRSKIQQFDLTKPLRPDRRYEMAICFEVAEHLPESAADTLVENLIALSDLILFSAAQPGQGGVDHINEQPCSYWQAKFEARGFALDDAATTYLRRAFGRQGSVWWLERNILVLKKAPSPFFDHAGLSFESRVPPSQ